MLASNEVSKQHGHILWSYGFCQLIKWSAISDWLEFIKILFSDKVLLSAIRNI